MRAMTVGELQRQDAEARIEARKVIDEADFTRFLPEDTRERVPMGHVYRSGSVTPRGMDINASPLLSLSFGATGARVLGGTGRTWEPPERPETVRPVDVRPSSVHSTAAGHRGGVDLVGLSAELDELQGRGRPPSSASTRRSDTSWGVFPDEFVPEDPYVGLPSGSLRRMNKMDRLLTSSVERDKDVQQENLLQAGSLRSLSSLTAWSRERQSDFLKPGSRLHMSLNRLWSVDVADTPTGVGARSYGPHPWNTPLPTSQRPDLTLPPEELDRARRTAPSGYAFHRNLKANRMEGTRWARWLVSGRSMPTLTEPKNQSRKRSPKPRSGRTSAPPDEARPESSQSALRERVPTAEAAGIRSKYRQESVTDSFPFRSRNGSVVVGDVALRNGKKQLPYAGFGSATRPGRARQD